MRVAPGVHRLGSPLVNWYLVEEEGSLTAIDAGLPAFAGSLERNVQDLGRELSDVKAVVLTHSDADHTGVAPRLQEAGARVLIHSGDQPTLRKPGPKTGDASPRHLVSVMHRRGFWRFFVGMARAGGAHPVTIEGAETFADGDTLDVPGRPRVVHTPGHTPGHCTLLLADRGVLFTGDALCTYNPVDRSEEPQLMPRPFNMDNEECLRSLEAIGALDAKLLLPGHGEPWHGGMATAAARARALAPARRRPRS